MKYKNRQSKGHAGMEVQATDKNMQHLFFRLLGEKVIVTFLICVTIVFVFFLLLYNPSNTALINVTVGNGNGENNDGTNYSSGDAVASRPPQETERPQVTEQLLVTDQPQVNEQPLETERQPETEQSEGQGETQYRVVARSCLRLRENPSIESAILMNLPYESEVISEDHADERGWMPVRVELSYGVIHGYVFAAYLVPVS